ncbi:MULTISPECIES: hypothetical protein [Pseudomonas]|jgi:hypothetical protein|uniref:DUF4239 domain-containing protein n=2 Tax=Pseudomonas psychrophila TaxID=122355 RepID=A0A8I1FSM0_9PSED|nr:MULTISPECIES: hypothetical protein [Pseudomonas]EPJ92798.1 hypothetical protein CF149_14547 [Pseudomonas psychrophila]KAB0492325.1 hypothetical protein F7Q95_05920 [Pseudomonas psychrophila]KMM99496.1 membrane protein [Pseudomonas psychrophila]KOX62661.1 hypothetical protein AA303_23045 [Pseudomonas psychrophila]MBJ2256295.1 hypothetical protein [Pseudomonas psychrophila]
MPSILYSVDVNSWYLLVSMLLGLCVAAFAGKMTWGQTVRRDAAFDDELKVVLGGTLSMFGLLMGFILSFAISGLNTRMTAEENEAIAIGNAFQRTTLLSESQQEQAEKMLMDYLAIRISFFATEDDDQRAAIRLDSIKMQSHMWALISKIAKEKPSSVIVTALNATNELYVSQQKTMASWRPQIPGVAWALLILFAICSNFLIGYNVKGSRGGNTLVCVMPIFTALALFMIAEIDVPGKGIIQVVPDNLRALIVTLEHGGLTL